MIFNAIEKDMIEPAPFQMQKYLINYLMNFPAAVKYYPYN